MDEIPQAILQMDRSCLEETLWLGSGTEIWALKWWHQSWQCPSSVLELLWKIPLCEQILFALCQDFWGTRKDTLCCSIFMSNVWQELHWDDPELATVQSFTGQLVSESMSCCDLIPATRRKKKKKVISAKFRIWIFENCLNSEMKMILKQRIWLQPSGELPVNPWIMCLGIFNSIGLEFEKVFIKRY